MNNIVIDIRNLTKTFQIPKKFSGFHKRFLNCFKGETETIKAVDNLSFTITKGEAVGLIGPNGAGKSTILKILTGILYPANGEVAVFGLVPWKQRKKIAKKIGVVFGQRSQLWFHLPPIDTFVLHARIYDIPTVQFHEKLESLAKLLDIKSYLNVPVRKLSLGQRMRCEIVCTLLHDPDLLLFDEPTIGLDTVGKHTLLSMITRLNQEYGTTIIFTSHDVNEIEKICNRLIVINRGSLVLDTDVAKLKMKFLKERVIEIHHRSKEISRLAVDMEKTNLSETLLALLKNNEISDIAILYPPLEDIIFKIYQHHNGP